MKSISESIIEKTNFIKPCRILLVLEDNQLTRLIKGTFRDIGISKLDIVSNTIDAENIYNTRTYDVVIIDLIDPVLDVFKFVSAVDHSKVIVLSKFIENEYKSTSIMAGADDYILKPVDFIELIVSIYELYKDVKNA